MSGCWDRVRQVLLLLWKNFLLQVRRPIGTVVEMLIPPVACAVVIILKFVIFDIDHRCFLTFDSDYLTLPVPNNSYQIFYAPNNSDTSKIMRYLCDEVPYLDVTGVANEKDVVDHLIPLNTDPAAHGLPPLTLRESIDRVNVSLDAGCFLGGAGIVFDNLDGNDLVYTLRLRHEVGEEDTWKTNENAFWFQHPGARVTNNFYLEEGFLHLQNMVSSAIVKWKANQTGGCSEDLEIAVKEMPYPSYRIDNFLEWNSAILPLLLIMAFIYSAGMFTKELVLEKETRIRESMFMMGLQLWVLWTTWFIKQFVFLFISSLTVTILLRVGTVFPKSNVLLVLLFFALFAAASIAWAFFISSWFTSARLGMLVAFVMWFFIYMPFFYIPSNYHEFSFAAKMVMCTLTNTCMGIGIIIVSEWEVREVGLTMDTVLEPLTIEDSFHMGYVLLMLLIDTIIFMTLAWYVNGVKPGRYGVPKPFYFPLLPSYWMGRPRRSKNTEPVEVVDDSYDPDLHEEEPSNMTVGISIRHLIKIYSESIFAKLKTNRAEREGWRRVAVNGLNLNMYEGQITALLGHNGAGKTTTISILTGLYTPTAGTAVINGYDIRSNMDQIRQSLGICPQHNVLFDRLTVLEHLKFFARLKGVRGKAVQEEADRMIEDLQLLDKRNTPSRALSGGMKRKLSVGIALIGGSKFVVLDEPTSGMDPHARRATWDLLIKHKEGRTMLLTTHFMDEADLLGDRIAIMAEGKLRCSGSSLFLKSRYGVGYRLVIVKEPKCDSSVVTDLVCSLVSGAQKATDVGAELSFVLPSHATQNFPLLFDTLEADKGRLGISSYGISVTTMEEVFMKVREGTEETLKHKLERSRTLSEENILSAPTHSDVLIGDGNEEVNLGEGQLTGSVEEEPVTSTINAQRPIPPQSPVMRRNILYHDESAAILPHDDVRYDSVRRERNQSPQLTPNQQGGTSQRFSYVPNTGVVLWLQHLRAMLMKRIFTSMRFWQAMVTQLVLPLLFVLNAMILAVTILLNDNATDPPRALTNHKSVLSPGNITYFWAEFDRLENGSPYGQNYNSFFAAEMPDLLGATNLFDYSERVSELINHSVKNGSNINQCSDYPYQMLDKYCASRLKGDFNDSLSSEDFPYYHCDDCLSVAPLLMERSYRLISNEVLTAHTRAVATNFCCEARTHRLPSCTYPMTQHFDPEEKDFCPPPPRLSLQDAMNRTASGRLDSDVVYMDELLMRIAHDMTPAVFTRRLVGGFVVSHKNRDPPYTVCGCMDTVKTSRDYFSDLALCKLENTTICKRENTTICKHENTTVCKRENTTVYLTPWNNFANTMYRCDTASRLTNFSLPNNCSDIADDSNLRDSLSLASGYEVDGTSADSISLASGYEVDGTSADILNGQACSAFGCPCECDSDRPVASYFQSETNATTVATVWYNNRAWHTSAAALNTFHNIWLRQATNNSELTLKVINHPLPRVNTNNLAAAARANLNGHYIGITVVFGYSFLVASFVLFLVAERETKAKHLQFVSGADITSYWIANLLWDLFNSLFPILASVVVIAVFRQEAYSGTALFGILLLLLLTCWSSIPIVYSVSFLFSNSLIAFGVVFAIFFLACLIFFLIQFVIQNPMIKDALHYVFLLNPSYALGIGLNDIYINHYIKDICTNNALVQRSCEENEEIRYVDNLFTTERPGIGVVLIYMAVEGVVFFIVTLLIEYRFFSKDIYRLYKNGKGNGGSELTTDFEMEEIKSPTAAMEGRDSDVVDEAKKVMWGRTDSNNAVIIKNLVKVYPKSLDGFTMRPSKTAVRGISLAIPTGQCFGLLGVNGAGKTTTFGTLIGDISPTSGTAVIAGYDIRTYLKKVQQRIGYCPQFDALIERMTGRELLTMFARLRGIPERLIKQAVEAEITRLDLSKHASKQCGKYSGGNKRKLSTAIALIGNPPIIMLDEPTTGMDPATRRYLWDVLTGLTKEGRSIVLTSHSMEECEALCTRLAIMVNGQFKCLGSTQHLKNKYGSGYTLQTKVRLSPLAEQHFAEATSHIPSGHVASTATSPVLTGYNRLETQSSHGAQAPFNEFDTTALHIFIQQAFPGALLLEEHQGAVAYQILSEGVTWATVFREMESNRERLGVVDYSVSQTTLEQVFVNFAKEQEEEEERT